MSDSMKRNRHSPRIFGAGLVTLDIVFDGTEIQSVSHSAGGTCGNVLAALAFMGWHSTPIARLGDDAAADAISGDLATSGVNTDALTREPGGRSSRIAQFVIRRRTGAVRHKFAFSCPSCGTQFTKFRPPTWEQCEPFTDLGRLGAPDVFFFDRVSPSILAMAEAFRAHGSLIYFEPSGIGKLDMFVKALGLCHIVKYSRERLHVALSDVGGVTRLASPRPRVEIETQGADGLRFRVDTGTKNAWRWHKRDAFRVTHFRDAAGAGDWCSAGTLMQLGWKVGDDQSDLTVEAVDQALMFGQALGALKCQHVGPRSIARVFASDDILSSARAMQQGDSETAMSYVPAPRKVAVVATRTRHECTTCLTT